MAAAAALALLCLPHARAQQAPAAPPAPSAAELAAQADSAAGRLKAAEDNLVIVEQQYAKRRDPTKDEQLLARYSDGELRYLLGDFRSAAVVFYDLVSDPNFRGGARYDDALFYLADALYQSNNPVVAKVYLKELLGRRTRHYREALLRYIEIAGRTNDFTDIDDFIGAARTGSGELPPELAYTYGKWNFRRPDLPLTERLVRSRAAFVPLAQNPQSRFRFQAAYFLAVAFVQEGDHEKAIEQFRRLTTLKADQPRDRAVVELSWMSLGRLYYETGKFTEAIDAYQQIPQNSEYFVDSLYEIAWTRVKSDQFQAAKNATDILLLVSPDSVVAPEAQILQGNLLAKLKKWNDASDAYTAVINRYGPVRDEVDALLTVNKDPVAYFDNLLASNDRNQDVAELLPPVARKWATTQREVSEAVSMVNDLEVGRRNVAEAHEMAARILKALDDRGFEIFPELQEGYTRADAVDSALTEIDEALTRVERQAVQGALGPKEIAELERLRALQAELRPRFQALPRNEEQVVERKRRMQQKVDAVEKDAFRSMTQLHSLFAQIEAVERYAEDTRPTRKTDRQQERDFRDALKQEELALLQLEQDLRAVRLKLTEERELAGAMLGGEGKIRDQYAEVLRAQQALLEEAGEKAPPELQAVLSRVKGARGRAWAMKVRVDAAKGQLRSQVETRREQIRSSVNAELALLSGYGGDVARYSGDARNLVGRIAFDSFKRVRQQFYDLVLKADVGVVDVAFTRKQDKTLSIQKLSAEKDRDLKRLDDEFREVLQEVD